MIVEARTISRAGISLAAVLVLALAASGCSGGGRQDSSAKPAPTEPVPAEPAPAEPAPGQAGDALNPADFSARVDHPLVALASVRLAVFQGSERDPKTGESVATRVKLCCPGVGIAREEEPHGTSDLVRYS